MNYRILVSAACLLALVACSRESKVAPPPPAPALRPQVPLRPAAT